jgi:hypothetical protein
MIDTKDRWPGVRTSIKIFGNIVMITSLVACSTEKILNQEKVMSQTVTNKSTPAWLKEIEFEAKIQVQAKELLISYKVVNKGKETLLILDSPIPKAMFDDPNYYIELAADGVVDISKRAYAPPDNAAFEVEPTLLASKLESGKTTTEEFRVPLPLKTLSLTSSITDRKPIPSDVKQVRFCLGIGPTSLGTGAADSGKVRVYHKAGAQQQQQLCSEVQNFK